LSDAEMDVAQTHYEFVSKFQEAIKEANLNPKKLNEFFKAVAFEDTTVQVNEDTGELEKKKVNTLLNPYRNYKFISAIIKDSIDKAEEAYNLDTSNTEKYNEYTRLKALSQKHRELFFQSPFTDEYVRVQNILNSSPLAREVKEERNRIIEDIEKAQMFYDLDVEGYETYQEIDQLERELSQLSSLY